VPLRSESARREVYELVKDVKFELQFKAVRKRLPCSLNLVLACVLESEDSEVKRNDQYVDHDEVAKHSLEVWTTERIRRPHQDEAPLDIESADERFLEDEPSDLEDFKLRIHR
jgi:hypothetical protein